MEAARAEGEKTLKEASAAADAEVAKLRESAESRKQEAVKAVIDALVN